MRLVKNKLKQSPRSRPQAGFLIPGIPDCSHFSNLLSGSCAFIDTEPNTFDALIVDEAHRLALTSALERDKNDKSIRTWKKMMMKEQPDLAKQETDLIIKKTSRSLMTQGMKGCYLYCTVPETAQYFASQITCKSLD